MSWIDKKIRNRIERDGNLPEFWNPFNDLEIGDIANTVTTMAGSITGKNALLYVQKIED